jgi:hypothetical protein
VSVDDWLDEPVEEIEDVTVDVADVLLHPTNSPKAKLTSASFKISAPWAQPLGEYKLLSSAHLNTGGTFRTRSYSAMTADRAAETVSQSVPSGTITVSVAELLTAFRVLHSKDEEASTALSQALAKPINVLACCLQSLITK